MPFRLRSTDRLLRYAIAVLSIASLAVLLLGNSPVSVAQDARKPGATQASAETGAAGRGRYLVEDVAMCGTCHTPRKANGELDRSRWLAGAPVPYLPARPTRDWPIQAPRLAGTPPAPDAAMITLLTTAIWTNGKPLRDPMPKFHMTVQDATAVVAYLKSLKSGSQ